MTGLAVAAWGHATPLGGDTRSSCEYPSAQSGKEAVSYIMTWLVGKWLKLFTRYWSLLYFGTNLGR